VSWEAVIAIVEVIGLVAIVGSLLYVGVQTKQANEHATAASTIAFLDGWNKAISGFANDEATSAALRKGFRSFNSLSKHEQAIFHARIGVIVNQWLLAQQLAERNLIPDEIPTEASKFVVAILSTPGGLEYWEHDSKATPRGDELLDMAKRSLGEQPNIVEVLPWLAAEDDE
jgi:hypothetical protein